MIAAVCRYRETAQKAPPHFAQAPAIFLLLQSRRARSRACPLPQIHQSSPRYSPNTSLRSPMSFSASHQKYTAIHNQNARPSAMPASTPQSDPPPNATRPYQAPQTAHMLRAFLYSPRPEKTKTARENFLL